MIFITHSLLPPLLSAQGEAGIPPREPAANGGGAARRHHYHGHQQVGSPSHPASRTRGFSMTRYCIDVSPVTHVQIGARWGLKTADQPQREV